MVRDGKLPKAQHLLSAMARIWSASVQVQGLCDDTWGCHAGEETAEMRSD